MITTIKEKIVPTIKKRNFTYYRIEITDPEYIIDEFKIYSSEDKKIEKIVITKGSHPNCDPKSKIFCIPEFLKEQEIDNDMTLPMIINMFSIWNFDSAYVQPWGSFEYLDEKPL